ncbi:Putative myc-type, basic helix-loop-helix (bHLH) domain-containing protein [Septoria linicola]|uniref:Myc-type, basic helix-loop-helix (BHLH) domain-containing protein n=1 Tax=Septoria linicola TaxID=215465 RepID=A0A9Q9AK94_9PEZI|nr:putative myc-type, basic helix-loop-helix (bHLH) domain-containing protein [Septoria linicola]USW47622.1 Putative myc-type, basic helix-loop-helix (bHLH) domain-containing protein [Septoria linicola]
MPRPNPPPTPGSSSDIRGKEGYNAGPALHLPPTAYQEQVDRAHSSSTTPSVNGSESSHSSYRPVSPTSPVEASRKRPAPSNGPVITKDDFALPPPPTRSRKIIQMKPKESEQQQQTQSSSASKVPATGENATATKAGSKRKAANSGTTAAGRKIARKTAHSLIERRRRSKMNEEFGVLKDMIPACQGQEMHKLAILQASTEYLRYLEQCVADLKTQTSFTQSERQPPPPYRRQTYADAAEEDDDEEMDDDQHEPGEGTATPATAALEHSNSIVSLPSLSQITTTTTTSPSVFSIGAGRHYSISSAASSYSPYFHSNQASPAFGPQLHHVAPAFGSAFGLGSPALKPIDSASHLRHIAEGATAELTDKQRGAARNGGRSEHELDQEATAALLMLNHDRRNWHTSQPERELARAAGGGMSVRDLLSN